MDIRRHLDRIEVKWLYEQAAQVYTYQGEIDEKMLTRAFEALCVRHPLLRARIGHDENGYFLEATDDHMPQLHAWRGDVGNLRAELGELRDPAEGVARLNLVTDDAGGAIALQTYLFVVDGQSWLALFSELWSLYTDLAGGATLTDEPYGTLPTPPSTVLERMGIPCPYRGSPSPMKPVIQVDRRLDADVTDKLLTVAHRVGTTVHGLICGGLLVVHRRQDPARGEARMVCLSAVDLRHRLALPVGKTDTTRLIGWHQTELDVRGDEDPVPLGRRVRDELTEAITSGELPLLRPSPEVAGTLDPRLSSVVTTNMGVIPPMTFPPELTVTGTSRIYPSTALLSPWHGFFTFQGEMTVMSVYPADSFTTAEAEHLTGGIIAILEDIAATA
ncbi:hypothetical protein LWP59_16120 [Amycolatopsis acidiphila]|uniref:Phthiocerol/phthiodiolone dimycocerosyl transferase n=1 Tax=Amycolatopsis acidiphila TaxID=715473 RepID=A0A557ZXU2_9PSEU|nr:hypothetical protein [Amycolatopsis acidiphila]TVT16838.1 hypothetical protein FNH06_33845 [Amycolatopsis acidiphila]UIJ63043.1 hypothetical protein LWP59_16120 [Amycolatopsis acidiphila]GHG65807.1 hypothetical protein GCM10017788_23560 [Amycolatopsis acidiphila]